MSFVILSIWGLCGCIHSCICDNEYEVYSQEEFENTKRVIRIRKSKDRQHNGQKKKYKQQINLQNTTQKKKDRATRTPLKPGG